MVFRKTFRITVVFILSILLAVQPAVAASGKVSYYLKDHLGNTRVVMDRETRRIDASMSYYPHGGLMPDACSSVEQSLENTTEKFTGKEIDETGLTSIGVRYYDAELGMWLTMDPKDHFDSPYAYSGVGTNPVAYVDPDGMEPVTVIIVTLCVLAGAYVGGAIANRTFDVRKWDYTDDATWMGIIGGGIIGGFIGAAAFTAYTLPFDITLGLNVGEKAYAGLQMIGQIGSMEGFTAFVAGGVGLSTAAGVYSLYEFARKEFGTQESAYGEGGDFPGTSTAAFKNWERNFKINLLNARAELYMELYAGEKGDCWKYRMFLESGVYPSTDDLYQYCKYKGEPFGISNSERMSGQFYIAIWNPTGSGPRLGHQAVVMNDMIWHKGSAMVHHTPMTDPESFERLNIKGTIKYKIWFPPRFLPAEIDVFGGEG